MTSLSHDRSTDPAIIAGIAREVIRRLRQQDLVNDQPAPAASAVAEKLITIETLGRYAAAGQVMAAPGAVITPAAREEARRRGIKIVSKTNITGANITGANERPSKNESDNDSQADALGKQLAHRGISLPPNVSILWTDRPAAEVHQQCTAGHRAVMVDCVSNVQRFADELDPQVWVLDRHKLNLIAAVNVAAQIARCPAPTAKTNAGGSR